MIDQTHQNPGAMTGTPALVAGALREDTNQALQFNGTTNSMSVPDSASASLAVADGAPGGLALQCWLKFASFPGSTQTVIGKAGSYELKVTSAGKLTWTLTNGAQSVTVTSATTLSTGQWYQVVGVYNGDYTGATVFGKQTTGAAQELVSGDYDATSATGHNNLNVSKETLLEKGRITSIVMDMQKRPSTSQNSWVAAVAYADSGGVPGAKIAQSIPRWLSHHDIGMARQWITFDINGIAYPGSVWLGYVGGQSSQRWNIGLDTSGGTRKWRNAAVTDSSVSHYGTGFPLTGETPDPFGTVVSGDSQRLAIYANYAAMARTGDEGFALLYLNGVLDASSAYTRGIADTANALLFASSVAVSIDEPSIWNKKLTPVEVARHYSAR